MRALLQLAFYDTWNCCTERSLFIVMVSEREIRIWYLWLTSRMDPPVLFQLGGHLVNTKLLVFWLIHPSVTLANADCPPVIQRNTPRVRSRSTPPLRVTPSTGYVPSTLLYLFTCNDITRDGPVNPTGVKCPYVQREISLSSEGRPSTTSSTIPVDERRTAQPLHGRTFQVNTPKAIVASPHINLDILYSTSSSERVRLIAIYAYVRVWRTRRRRHLNVKTAQVSWKVTNCSCFFLFLFFFLGKWRILLGWGHREASWTKTCDVCESVLIGCCERMISLIWRLFFQWFTGMFRNR